MARCASDLDVMGKIVAGKGVTVKDELNDLRVCTSSGADLDDLEDKVKQQHKTIILLQYELKELREQVNGTDPMILLRRRVGNFNLR